jgi:hypothetical protein
MYKPDLFFFFHPKELRISKENVLNFREVQS